MSAMPVARLPDRVRPVTTPVAATPRSCRAGAAGRRRRSRRPAIGSRPLARAASRAARLRPRRRWRPSSRLSGRSMRSELAAARAGLGERRGREARPAQLAAGLGDLEARIADATARVLAAVSAGRAAPAGHRRSARRARAAAGQDAAASASALPGPRICSSALREQLAGKTVAVDLSAERASPTCASSPGRPCSRPGSAPGRPRSRRRCA